MKEYILNVAGHSADLKKQPTGSKDTGIFFPQELIEFLGGNENYTFKIYREDFIKALASIIYSLPLYSNKGGKKITHINSYEECSRLLSIITNYFGNAETATYSGFSLTSTTEGRRYLYGLVQRGFSIRNFLVADYSVLKFQKEDDGTINLRFQTNVVGELNTEKYEVPDIQEPSEDNPLQQIFYGAPGTGKSHKVKCDVKVENAEKNNLVFRTTFHPDSDYSTFVGAYKPTMKPVADKYKAVIGKDEEITYDFVPQAFLQAYIAAWNNPEENVFLVIEEINRGNCAQIFGDLFQLLDRDKDGISEYPIKADRDLAKYLCGKDDDGNDILVNKEGIKDGKLKLPKNLYIWATMNTSDQSLFPIDSAFKRRWEWEYMPIGYKNSNWKIEIGDKKYNWVDFQKVINQKIYDVDNSEDKQLGDYFVNADRTGCKISADTLLNKILFYIWNDVCKDDHDQIFRWKTDKSHDESIKFSDFFGIDQDKKLQGFMEFHNVPAIGESQNIPDAPQGSEGNPDETPAEENNE